MTVRTVGIGSSVPLNATAKLSNAFNVQSTVMRIVAKGASAHVAITTGPLATNTDFFILSGEEEQIALTKGSQVVVGITTGTTTILEAPEGTQMPFIVGDYVTLDTANDANYTTLINHVKVTDVNNNLPYGASGFGKSRVTVDANTATGTHANAFVFTKSKNTYWNGLGFQSSHGHVGAIVGMRDSTAMNTSHKIRIEIGGTGINASEEKTWDFLNTGDLSISDGNLVVASGHGIDFSAHGNTSSMTSELLDDYEEGSWLPSFYPQSSAMTHSYNLRTGTYVKIGSVVYWAFRMRLSGLSGQMGQTMGFAGLPYTVDNSQPQFTANLYGESYNGETATGMFYDGGTTRGTLYYHKNDVQNRLYASDLNPTHLLPLLCRNGKVRASDLNIVIPNALCISNWL